MASHPVSDTARLDLSQRIDPALLPELMDAPCAYETFRDCVRDIAASTRVTLAYRPTFAFLKEAIAHRGSRSPLHVLDVGSGGGDTLRRIALWARRRRLSVQLTGIDLNPHASRAATEFSSRDPNYSRIQWLTGDVFTHPVTQSPDLVISSLVTHHMRDEEIVRFLRWMDEHAQLGWFISDLVRSPRSYRIFGPLSRVLRWHPFVQHDGLVSIRRAFREPDWERLLATAGIPISSVRMERCAIGRLCLTRLR
ncbi:MAG TPA: methyltransferase domain-containing protein [Acidobacteriaceae bacterium]|nr:methyltransferase domain-containing protein [Acidobacteriaceae bacterium]